MDRYCPECNSNMTPSLVGYLCPNCGNIQRFYTMTGTQLKSTSIPATKSAMNTDDSANKVLHTQDPIKTQEYDDESRNKVRSTLKRLMIPELAPPHDHGEPAKIIDSQSKSISEDSYNIFENYDDLLDTTVNKNDVDSAPVQSEIDLTSASALEEKIQKAEIKTQEKAETPKKLPIWVWLTSALVIFLTTTVILLLIVVL
jgi:DNA-directed RNA polymerase subunit M/transcription elongation factor TFIIS